MKSLARLMKRFCTWPQLLFAGEKLGLFTDKFLICNKKEDLEKLVNQMKILSDNLKDLLKIFCLHNY
jgi:hypothetical protein